MNDDNCSCFDLTGPGPFELPLIDKFISLTVSEENSVLIAECMNQDHQTLYLPISFPAARLLGLALSTVPATEAGKKLKTAHEQTPPTTKGQ